jgi:hypothetical protein
MRTIMGPLARYRRVVLLAPTGATGGPEAIHQLAHSLNSLGIEAYLVYFGAANVVQVRPDRIVCRTPEHAPTLQAYRAYRPRVAAEIPLDARTLVVIPEAFATHHPSFRDCGAAIWWLSVDNALKNEPALATPEGRAELFARRDLIHLHQSIYARDWLRAHGAQTLLELGDYTSAQFTAEPAERPSPRPAAAYNLAKGASLAQDFFAAHPRFEALGLKGFSKPELREIFAERLLYVDFGHFPGKDRMPREAAACGAVVFVHRQGAGALYDDFPLPDFFKFTAEDVASGELARRLDAVVADPQAHWARQANFRSLIDWEKAQFHDQVMRLWGVRRML